VIRVPDEVVRRLQDALGAADVQRDAAVARYTTWRVGGPAALLAVARDAERLRHAVEIVREANLPWLVLGRGSNVLVCDEGVRSVVIINRADALRIEGTTLWAESGGLLSVLARRTTAAGLEGLEWCHDIPGSVGGAVVNNAGAHGGSMSDVLRRVRVLPPWGAVADWDAATLDFGYRRSILREGQPSPVVLEAVFELRRADAAEVRARMAAHREQRKRTQPGGASAGSVFKNPPGDSAGRLIESLGLKGARRGDAAISDAHANFIVGGPRATAADVVALVALARRRVRVAYGLSLEPEIQYVYPDGRVGPPSLEDPEE